MVTLITCEICQAQHSQMREHCPFCGARKVMICSHSYEPLKTRVTYRDSASGCKRQMLRAYVTRHVAHSQRKMDVTLCD